MFFSKKAILCGFLLAHAIVFSQTVETPKGESKVDVGIDGMLGVSIGNKTVGINVGGPTLKFHVNNFKIGVGAMPSLFINDKKAVPRLAVSPIIEYKKWMVIAPYYGYNAADKMIWTFGVGYKFG
jgi:hypothetical protein